VLTDRRIVVTGVLTDRSLAFSAAELLQRHGAEVILTGHKRARRLTERVARQLPRPAEVLELDVLERGDFGALAEELGGRWDRLDGLLHAIAYAPSEVWQAGFFDAPRDGLDVALDVSAFSLRALVRETLPLMEASDGASVLALTSTPERFSVDYGWMAVVKATLNALTRQMAIELGPRGIRVNALACGPVATVAGSAIPGFANSAAAYRDRAPLGWDSTDGAAAAGTAVFLLSDLSRGMTGEILNVDGGMHIAL
jgi:enoyl-[acyl-carrier protein] reductase I